ncbi:MAG: DUF1499 domain-containing protein [Alphaproteobacteria bacterium]
MAAEVREKWSSAARWSFRFSIIGGLTTGYSVFLHRYGLIESPAAFALLVVGFSIVFVALCLGAYSILATWIKVVRGLRYALGGTIISCAVLAWPAYILAPGIFLPAIHDISTDLDNPPRFTAAMFSRPPWANSLDHSGADSVAAEAQRQAYPQIEPLLLEMETDEAYALALNTVEQKGWRISARLVPREVGASGVVEAVATTPIMGFADDIVIRVRAAEGGTLFDVRSVSRFGKSDLGRNANRIQQLLSSIENFENR